MKLYSAISIAALAALPSASFGMSDVELPFPRTPVEQMIRNAPGERDSNEIPDSKPYQGLAVVPCASIPAPVRAMVFEHFRLIRDHQRRTGGRFDGVDARLFARALGRVPGESSGDPTCMTRMNGSQVGTYQARSNLATREELFTSGYNMGVATNWGLTQISANRFYVDLPSHVLNETIRVLTHDDNSMMTTEKQSRAIFQGYVKLARDEWAERRSLERTLRLCGTPFLYDEGKQGEKGLAELEKAMLEILDEMPYSREKDPRTGAEKLKWAQNPKHAAAFGKWVTLCPNMGFDLGILPPPRYFDPITRSKIACEATFRSILKE